MVKESRVKRQVLSFSGLLNRAQVPVSSLDGPVGDTARPHDWQTTVAEFNRHKHRDLSSTRASCICDCYSNWFPEMQGYSLSHCDFIRTFIWIIFKTANSTPMIRSFTVINRSVITLKVFSGVKMDIGSKYFISAIIRTILSIICCQNKWNQNSSRTFFDFSNLWKLIFNVFIGGLFKILTLKHHLIHRISLSPLWLVRNALLTYCCCLVWVKSVIGESQEEAVDGKKE